MTAQTSQTEPMQLAQKRMKAGDLDGALSALSALLSDEPEHVDALFLTAVCYRYQNRLKDAQDTLSTVLKLAPEFGRALQEEGHVFRAQGQSAEALSRYRLAVQINPALHAAWTAQAQILSEQGQSEAAGQCAAQAKHIKALSPMLLAAMHHLYEHRLLKAEELCRAWLSKHPRDVAGMRLLAEIGTRLGVLEDAEFLLESAVEFAPDNADLRVDYIRVLRKRQKFEAALEQARALYDRDPHNPVFISQLAIERMQTGAYAQAVELFDEVLKLAPYDPATLTSKGHALKTWGRQDEAIAAYQAACQATPDHGDAWYGLANLKTYRFSQGERDTMAAQEARPGLTLQNQINLNFALGKAFDDASSPEVAFRHYERGNRLKTVQTRYTSDQMQAEFEAQKQACTRELFENRSGQGNPSSDPIFIVGLPRAGSTLLEQILASHSQVDGTLELPNIIAISQSLRGRLRGADKSRYPGALSELSADELNRFGQRYLDETAIHRKGAPFFTDKMPNNFRHIGLIKLILPNARIIDARRHPLACCVSGFKQLFAEGQEFSYGLAEIGHYYRGYVDLMDHWDTVLPGHILRVIHEDVVADLETQVRRILEFCGLPFEQSCVEFHKTRREVRTASSEQVRQPINTKGLEQWKAFEPWLDPLKSALGPVLNDWRHDTPLAR